MLSDTVFDYEEMKTQMGGEMTNVMDLVKNDI